MKTLFIQAQNSLEVLKEEKFPDELSLQLYLEVFPELLPRTEIIGNPSFFLLDREVSVSTGFIDHLFIDDRMIPTIVETKVHNPEIRRKIIGQGYEYLTSVAFELSGKRCVDIAKNKWGVDYHTQLKKRLGIDALLEDEIDKNLKRPRLRLLFVADFIPRELKKFIEFINTASRGIDVYAVQIEKFPVDGKTIVSISTFGPTEHAIYDKAISWGVLTIEECIRKIQANESLNKQERDVFSKRMQKTVDLIEDSRLTLRWTEKTLRLFSTSEDQQLTPFIDIDLKGGIWGYFIEIEKRSDAIINAYARLDSLIDLEQKYLEPQREYKMGKRLLYELTEDEFQSFTSYITTAS